MKVFNSSVLGARHQRSGNYCVIKRTGLIMFSRDMNELLKGKRVNFLQDETRPKDWYVEITKEASGIPVRYIDKVERHAIQSSVIAREILQSCDITAGGADFTISSEPDTTASGKSYAILTSTGSPVTRQTKKKAAVAVED